MSRNLGALRSWNPVVLFRPVMGQLYIIIIITAVGLLLGGSNPYTTTDKTNKNKYT
jgi:hypothetical protein